MQKGTTLFQLRTDRGSIFDGSNYGVTISRFTNVKVLPRGAGFSFANGVVEIARNKHLDTLSDFTIETTLTPTRIGPERQNILEGQSPAIALFLSPEGKLVGSMFINGVWTGLDSGSVTLTANRAPAFALAATNQERRNSPSRARLWRASRSLATSRTLVTSASRWERGSITAVSPSTG
jgi:hypothetical protein